MTESAGSFQSTGREPCDRSGIVEAPCLFASCPWACAHRSDAAWRRQDGFAPLAKTVTHPPIQSTSASLHTVPAIHQDPSSSASKPSAIGIKVLGGRFLLSIGPISSPPRRRVAPGYKESAGGTDIFSHPPPLKSRSTRVIPQWLESGTAQSRPLWRGSDNR